jgi:GDP-4-dehydro-6-deoxy-D-mannose reductase
LRALITGCGGFAGSHLAEHLAAVGGWEVWGTVFRPGEADRLGGASLRLLPADLRRPEEARQALEAARPEVVFHLAGQAFVPEATRDPWATFETNVRMQLNLLEVLAAMGEAGRRVRVVAVTSQDVYGTHPPLPTDETAPLAPANAYAASKASQDLLAGQYVRSHGLDVVIARPFNHIGPRQDPRFVVASFAKQLAEIEAGLGPAVVSVGDLGAARDFTDVRDIVVAYRLLAERGVAGEAYNLGSGVSRSIREVLHGLLEHVAVVVEVQPDPERMRPSDTPRTLCDARKAAAALGWAPRVPFRQSLLDTLDGARAALPRGLSQAAETLGS